MKISADVVVNLKTKEFIDKVTKATKESLGDTVADIASDSIKGSPRLTGNNMRSIMFEVGPGGEVAKGDLEGAVYSTSGYGGILETGHHTKSGSWVAPRPYFKPSLDRNFTADKFSNKVREHLT